VIRLEGVGKRYGELHAVQELSLTVERGELCCLIGPSGCGKSTTLKMINRMVEPTTGRIFVDGRDVSGVPPDELRRGMGYVIQSIGLFPHMTVSENVRVVPRLLGWKEERSERRAMELLELLELPPEEFAAKYPRELSGGQAQRVGVARALAADPDILLMDEPFGALDPINREHLQNRFLAIQKDLGKTVVFVTHDIDEAVRLGSKVGLLRDGRLEQYASPETLLSAPANPFVKKFVGLDRALKRLSRLSARDFVRPAGSVLRSASPEDLEAGFRRMQESDCPRYLWVTDGDRRLLGWIDGRNAAREASMEEDMVEIDPADMSVRADYSLKQALSMFVQQGVACLPVVDGDRRLQGEIRLTDLLDS
jgi:osmoprotectant transport system ATP-binding protein